MICLKLFLTFAKIGLFSFGGGYAMLPFIQQEVVSTHHWLGAGDFVDVVAISQMTPGPIAINAASFVGYRVGGLPGSICATFGLVLLPFLLMLMVTSVLFRFQQNRYVQGTLRGIRPTLIGLIGAATLMVGQESFVDVKSIPVFLLSFYLAYRSRLNPVLVIIIAGLAGWFIYGVFPHFTSLGR